MSIPLIAVLVTIESYLQGLILKCDITSGNTNSKASVVPEVTHARNHVFPRIKSLILEFSLDIFLEIFLVVVLRLISLLV